MFKGLLKKIDIIKERLAGIKNIVNYVGGNSPIMRDLAKEYLEKAGLKVELMNCSEETEAAKILSTTYYGVCILFMKRVLEMCEDLDLDFSNIYTRWNTTYNDGMVLIGLPHVRRPVLLPEKGEVGGHCVIPNLRLLPVQIMDWKTFLNRVNEGLKRRNREV